MRELAHDLFSIKLLILFATALGYCCQVVKYMQVLADRENGLITVINLAKLKNKLKFQHPSSSPSYLLFFLLGENDEVNLNECQELARLQSV